MKKEAKTKKSVSIFVGGRGSLTFGWADEIG